MTAAEIKRHLPPPPMQPSGAQGTARPTLPPPPPSQVLDATGWPIPTQLIPLWQRAGEVQEMLTILSRVKGALRAAQENRDKLFAEVNFSSALSQLDQAWTDIKTAKPFAVCPTCQGQLPDKCTLCRGRGLISEHRWNTCVTREDKEFRARRRKQKTEQRKGAAHDSSDWTSCGFGCSAGARCTVLGRCAPALYEAHCRRETLRRLPAAPGVRRSRT